MAKIGRNQRCPCGSGKKYKHCCLRKGTSEAPFGQEQRHGAILRLLDLADDLSDQHLEAQTQVWGLLASRRHQLPHEWIEASHAFSNSWFWFDRALENGRVPADFVLEHGDLPPGERTWLRQMRASSIRLYEVVDARPGRTLTLKRSPDGELVTVEERTLSRSARHGDTYAARVIPFGVSGGPEIDLSIVDVPRLVLPRLLEALDDERTCFFSDEPEATEVDFWKSAAPLIHEAWVSTILDPVLPKLQNTDGEELVWSKAVFDVLDAEAVRSACNEAFDAGGEDRWSWLDGERDPPVSLGTLHIAGERLVLETNSVARSTRGRQRIEALAGSAMRYVTTSYELVEESIRRRKPAPVDEPAIPYEVQEPLVLAHYARHYRGWVDEPVPALGGVTPRIAARRPELRHELVALIRGIEGMYQQALRAGAPAYDPSWMWEELGLAEGQPEHPPPLVHERLYEAYPGLSAAVGGVAGRLRDDPAFDDASTRCRPEALEDDLAIRRIRAAHPSLAPHLGWLVDVEAHRRKVFWVDRGLAWQLAHTELDTHVSDLRLPFPAFLVVFTDRTACSKAERWIARERSTSPVAGHFVRVLTVVVTGAPDHGLHLHAAADALGADPPEVLSLELAGAEHLTGDAEDPSTPPRDALVHLVVSAVLRATSAGPEPAPRRAPAIRIPAGRRFTMQEEPLWSSDQVFFLPGAIRISELRTLQEIERAPGGRQLLHRFLVRGHWRRPNASWKDQRMRWIEPYWKGPPMGPVIEKAYRLEP